MHQHQGLSCVEIAQAEGASDSTVLGALKRRGAYVSRRTKSPRCTHTVTSPDATLSERRRVYALRYGYGITIEQHDAMLVAQGGVCAICKGPPVGIGNRLHVDHDHATGVVRGLLCSNCNTSLGKMNDDPERLRAAAAYLEARRG